MAPTDLADNGSKMVRQNRPRVWLAASEVQHVAEGHHAPSTNEVDIVRDQNGLLVVAIHRDVIVTGQCQTGVSNSPALVTRLPEQCYDSCVDVVIEHEPQ